MGKIVIFFLLISLSKVFASDMQISGSIAEATKDASNFAIGWNINSLSNNYGLGMTIQSPRFWKRAQIRLSGIYAWANGIPTGTAKYAWKPFGLVRLGLFSGSFLPNSSIRGYGGGGIAMLIPSDEVSSQGNVFGGYGLIGLEFFGREGMNGPMFIEVGGMGAGARADKFENEPLYANGFTVAWGFRYFL